MMTCSAEVRPQSPTICREMLAGLQRPDDSMCGFRVQDAAKSFEYPSSITSVSYAMRKAYVALLWDYEQVHRWLECPGGSSLLASRL